MTTFALVRHAAFDGIGHTLAGRAPGFRLNDRGKAQAAALAERLAVLPIAAVFSSPMERTRETACAIARRLGLQIQIEEALNELDYGEWTGKTVSALDPLPAWSRFNAVRAMTVIPGGEDMLQVAARVVGVMERLRQEFARQFVALVTHGDCIRAAVAHCCGAPLKIRRASIFRRRLPLPGTRDTSGTRTCGEP